MTLLYRPLGKGENTGHPSTGLGTGRTQHAEEQCAQWLKNVNEKLLMLRTAFSVLPVIDIPPTVVIFTRVKR